MLVRTLTVTTAAMVLTGLSVTAVQAAPTATKYANCTELQKKYPHGVGKSGARDLIAKKYVAGKSVTTFKVSTSIYNANSTKDRDKDGVACEKR